MHGRQTSSASKWLAFGIGLLLLAAVAGITLQVMRRPKPMVNKVIVGSRDQVYYSLSATMQEATALGHALEGTGFFSDRGASVQLSKHKGVAVISFVVGPGGWDHADSIAGFEEIGRRVATSVGGFPIQIHLVDGAWNVRKSLVVGKVVIGAKDAIYYLGSATEADARALGQALRNAGYLADLGVSVAISKGDGTAIGFVVDNGVWDRPEAVAAFQRLGRQVAASVGGRPIQVRLLSAEMEVKREVEVP